MLKKGNNSYQNISLARYCKIVVIYVVVDMIWIKCVKESKNIHWQIILHCNSLFSLKCIVSMKPSTIMVKLMVRGLGPMAGPICPYSKMHLILKKKLLSCPWQGQEQENWRHHIDVHNTFQQNCKVIALVSDAQPWLWNYSEPPSFFRRHISKTPSSG